MNEASNIYDKNKSLCVGGGGGGGEMALQQRGLEDPRFDSQQPHSGSQPSAPVLGDLISSSDHHRDTCGKHT